MVDEEKEDKKEEESEKKEEKKIYKNKDKILDESFKQAQQLKTGKPKKSVLPITLKKPFIKIGLLIVIIALIGLFIINFVPFLYINYETEDSSIEQYISYQEFKYDQLEPEKIYSLFESTCIDCSENSDSYIGLTINDFIDTPKFTIYVFYIMIIIGAIFTIFMLVNRKRNFSENTIIIVHSIFTAFIIITGIIILILNMKFLAANLLQQLNKPFLMGLGFKRVQLLFFMPYFQILISFILFIIGLILMKLNLNNAVDKYNLVFSEKNNLRYKFGSKI
ncbi:hypothetical protein AYK21_02490 [Thermoplasmatales archaeon SG8-52-2]|nr:MAG: hypothetical protein AYK21_02490 [Thermoplasmatales archaeon SG8-52-2]